uniref:LAGLIDADG homing endonuclease n=1 Tax=Phanerochaete carnosa TaxID=231932 RepID=A0A895KV77_9APHY|nr:LAGLIDADG homing endonuclease [Phanerochaete carnosa]QRZ60427.1 LAGLIDADG homing endonuclease [Phanerochaete carnosa]
MRRFSIKANTRLVFRQGSINAGYLLHLYSLFQKFVNTPPSVTTITDPASGNTRYNLSFTTLALPCFNPLYDKFYVNGKKVVPANIADFLTSVSLANFELIGLWMTVAAKPGSGLKLYTNAFCQDEHPGALRGLPYQPSWCGAEGTRWMLSARSRKWLVEALDKNFSFKASINKSSIAA